VLAYEMARQIVAAGGTVELLAMFDGMVPGSRRRLPFYRRVPIHLRRWSRLGLADAMSDITRKVRKRLGLRPRKPGGAAAAVLDPAAAAAREAQNRVLRAYRPPPYAGVITLFRATALPEWVRYDQPRPFNGWDAVCDRVEVHPVPGDHLSLLRDPHLPALAAALNAVLARFRRGG
jgi:thioesterase domain-containing protein